MLTKIGKIKVKEKVLNDKYWLCECACGNIVPLTKEEIASGKTCHQACSANRGEICVADLFNEMGITYQVQKKFDDFDLRFDFYLPTYNIIIECDGAQHFRSVNNDWDSDIKLQETRERDMRKKEYCEAHGITLLQIPFWDKKKLTQEYLKKVLGGN